MKAETINKHYELGAKRFVVKYKISRNITKAIDSLLMAQASVKGSKQEAFYNSRADVYLNRSQGIDNRYAKMSKASILLFCEVTK